VCTVLHLCALADADWLAEVTSCRQLSPNHDLCCRLLSHIPLLAAYTGWPTEYQLNIHSQPGTPSSLQTTNNSNCGSDVTAAGMNAAEDKAWMMEWRPSEDDKKYIEETVRCLMDSEDLCRLLMVAMATELERLASSEHEVQSDSTSSPRCHVVQSSVHSAAGDRDHGDITNHVDAVQGVAGEYEQYKIMHDFCSKQTNSQARGYFDEQVTGNIGFDSESTGDILYVIRIIILYIIYFIHI